MNDLSWLIYLAGTLPSLAWAVCVISFLSTIPLSIIVFLGLTRFLGDADRVHKEDVHYNNAVKGELANPTLPALSDKFSKLWWAPCFTMFLYFASFLVPPQETFYAIAASEMGEEIVKSETAGKAMKALDAWLDRQIEEPVEEVEREEKKG